MSMTSSTQAEGPDDRVHPVLDASDGVDMTEVLEESQVMEVLQQLDQELVGLKSV